METILYATHVDETAILSAIIHEAGSQSRPVRESEVLVESLIQRPADLTILAISGDPYRLITEVRQLRMHTVIPILLIIDSQPEDRQVELMDAGADWIVIRPYGVRLLTAQIRGLLRRSGGMPFHTLPTLTHFGISLDPSTRMVQVRSGDPVRLTQLEFRLMYTFITHPGQIIPAENLVEYVWGYSGEGNRELVRGLVQRLRTKIEPDPGNPVYILTEPGIGYMFTRETTG